MARVLESMTALPGAYLFKEIATRVAKDQKNSPGKRLLKLGIGDVTLPLAPSVVAALHAASDEMSDAKTFKGYSPDQGYAFLINAILENEYNTLGVKVSSESVFISDGAKSDTASIQEIFSADSKVAVADPVYPVYVDSNAMAGRAGVYKDGRWSNLVYLPCSSKNGFLPPLPDVPVDLVYLCSPNNPTGSALNKEELTKWVKYAQDSGAVILYDAAYRAYIHTPGVPHSIYEIPGADQVAIEFGSFSKTAGFTGLRCSWTVVPDALMGKNIKGEDVSLQALWRRRNSTKYNGTAYIIQRAAEAIYTDRGKTEVRSMVAKYMKNAQVIRDTLESLGLSVSGGVDAPYIWFVAPSGEDSWSLFDRLLSVGVVGTPGAGFGPCGEGCFRLTAFGSAEDTEEAMERVRNLLG